MIVLLGILLTLVVIIFGTSLEGRSQKALGATKSNIQGQLENPASGVTSSLQSDTLVVPGDSILISGRDRLATTSSMSEESK